MILADKSMGLELTPRDRAMLYSLVQSPWDENCWAVASDYFADQWTGAIYLAFHLDSDVSCYLAGVYTSLRAARASLDVVYPSPCIHESFLWFVHVVWPDETPHFSLSPSCSQYRFKTPLVTMRWETRLEGRERRWRWKTRTPERLKWGVWSSAYTEGIGASS